MADDQPLNGQITVPPQRNERGRFLPGHTRLGGKRRGTQNRMTARLYALLDDELERRGLSAVRSLDDLDLLKVVTMCRSRDDAPDHQNEELPKFQSSAELREHIRDKYGREALDAFIKLTKLMDRVDEPPFWPSQR